MKVSGYGLVAELDSASDLTISDRFIPFERKESVHSHQVDIPHTLFGLCDARTPM